MRTQSAGANEARRAGDERAVGERRVHAEGCAAALARTSEGGESTELGA